MAASAELIAMEPGTRPFRTCIGVDFGVRDRNALLEPLDAGLLEALGMAAFVTLAPAARGPAHHEGALQVDA